MVVNRLVVLQRGENISKVSGEGESMVSPQHLGGGSHDVIAK